MGCCRANVGDLGVLMMKLPAATTKLREKGMKMTRTGMRMMALMLMSSCSSRRL